MIEINLLPGQKRKAAGGMRFRVPDLRSVLAQVTDPWLLAAIAVAVIAVGGNAVLYVVNTARASRLESVLKGVRTEQRRFAAVVAQKHSAERVRDSLAAEMTIIRGIDADRYIWPHILDEVTKALPAYTWVTNIQAVGATPRAGPPTPNAPVDTTGTELGVSIDGRTVDIEAYTTFLRQLAASPWLRDIVPTRATTVIEQDRPVTEFNITARYRAADSLYIRTVPLVQSVR
jgi:Tfp pilus assembly protein PilN